MNLFKNKISLLSFLLLLSAVFSSCSRPSPQQEDVEKNNLQYVSCSFSTLRSHGDDTETPGTTDPNTDQDNYEDRIISLRVILFYRGTDRPFFNKKLERAEISSKAIVFSIKKDKPFDMYIIANEDSAQSDFVPFFRNSFTRTELETFRYAPVLTSVTDYGKGILMTACYKNLKLQRTEGKGSRVDPYILDLSAQNREQRPNIKGERKAVELMRNLAKVELILKDLVELMPSSTKENKSFQWAIPYGFHDYKPIVVKFKNYPATTTLFPISELTPSQERREEISETLGRGSFVNYSYVVVPTNWEDISVGGVRTLDYKLSFFVPEAFNSLTQEEKDKPQIVFEYYTNSMSGYEDPKIKSFPLQNGTTPTHYDYIVNQLSEKADWNIYRNRYYKIPVTLTGKGEIIF